MLNTIYDEITSDINVLQPIMNYWIMKEFYTILIIIVNTGHSHFLLEQIH